MNTATKTDTDQSDETLRTKSAEPWTIEFIGDQLKTLTDEEITASGENRPEIEEGAVVLGETPESAKKFFTLSEKYFNEAETFAKNTVSKIKAFQQEIDAFELSDFTENEAKVRDFGDELHNDKHRTEELESKGKSFASLGWTVIRDTFGWTCENSYGIRKGWTVVEPAPKPDDSFAELLGLGELFGGGVIGIGIGIDKDGNIR